MINRWQEHFSQVLNITSDYLEQSVGSVPPTPVRDELGVPPSQDEILNALLTLKSGKSGGCHVALEEEEVV